MLETFTVPLPFGTRLIFVLVPPAVNVSAPVPVIDPLFDPVPPFVTESGLNNVVVPSTYKLLVYTVPPMPIPPLTITEPLVVEDEFVLFVKLAMPLTDKVFLKVVEPVTPKPLYISTVDLNVAALLIPKPDATITSVNDLSPEIV